MGRVGLPIAAGKRDSDPGDCPGPRHALTCLRTVAADFFALDGSGFGHSGVPTTRICSRSGEWPHMCVVGADFIWTPARQAQAQFSK